MNGMTLPFDDALDAGVDALQRGRPLDAVVADHGHAGAMLRPLLEAANAVSQSATRPPLSRALEHNYAIVRAAVERAQMAAVAQPREAAPAPKPWWGRRLSIASLSLPIGAVVMALTLGVAGATASLVATDHGGVLGDLVSPVLPDALVQDNADNSQRGAAPASNDDGPSNNDAPGIVVETPGAENGPLEVIVDGTVSDVHGNTFTLTAGDREYQVQIDSKTSVDGEILEGATAEVTGDLTAEKNLHATDVSAQAGTPDADRGKPDDMGKPDDTGKPDNTGKPEDTGTPDGTGKPDDPRQPGDPPGQDDGAHEPPGQDDGALEPPGQSGDPPGNGNHGNGNNGNGNGGGPKKP